MKKAILTTIAIAVASASLSANAGFMFRSELHGVKSNADYASPEQDVDDSKEFEDTEIYSFLIESYTAFGSVYKRDYLTEDLTTSEYEIYLDNLIAQAESSIEDDEAIYKVVIYNDETIQVLATLGSTLN